jgi:hypothetical protein
MTHRPITTAFKTFFFAILAVAASSPGLASVAAPAPTLPASPTVAESLRERWGIEIVAIRESAAGYMLDFRYKVLDPAKAAPLFERKNNPYLIDEVTGAKFLVPNPPKTGPLRTTYPPKAGRTYFMFFANPGKYIKPGSRVTVVVGDFRADGLVVQ